MRSLVVDLDSNGVDQLSRTLFSYGWVVETAIGAEEAIAFARFGTFDLIFLSVGLKARGGVDALREIRNKRIEVPIVIHAAAARVEETVNALQGGADDFLIGVIDQTELHARLQAITRRARGYSRSELQVGPLTMNLRTHDVDVSGRPVHLTNKEFAALEFLVLRKGTVLSKDAFLTHLYNGPDQPDGKIIDVFICKIRKKLADAGAAGIIRTVWGNGYMLVEPSRAVSTGIGPADVREIMEIA